MPHGILDFGVKETVEQRHGKPLKIYYDYIYRSYFGQFRQKSDRNCSVGVVSGVVVKSEYLRREQYSSKVHEYISNVAFLRARQYQNVSNSE